MEIEIPADFATSIAAEAARAARVPAGWRDQLTVWLAGRALAVIGPVLAWCASVLDQYEESDD